MRPRRQAGTLARALGDDETVVLGPDGSRAVVLNSLGSVVWELCDGTHEVDEMARLICEILPEEPGRVSADVAALVKQLVEMGLVEEVDG